MANLDHIKRYYYVSHESINPTGVVSKGPILNLEESRGRERLSG